MDRTKHPRRPATEPRRNFLLPPRPRVRIRLHADGYVEVFGNRPMSARIERVPLCTGHERLAEDVADLAVPRVFEDADILLANGTTRPLTPTTMLASRRARAAVVSLNSLAAELQGVAS